MHEKDFNLERYMSEGVEDIVRDLAKASLLHPSASRFMAKFALASRRAAARRHELELQGEHIPSFLIASITSLCNLHCAGCYARSLDTCTDGEPVQQLTGEEWGRIFAEAVDLGISFILLAGGEPMVRRDVLEQAAKYPEIAFPIFTNGTMMNEAYLELLDKNRNLLPVISMEGERLTTDQRRGLGVYERLQKAMEELKKRRIVFGVSVTVTTANLGEVTSDAFLQTLRDAGCKAVIYVEFVPTAHDMDDLAPDEACRQALADRILELRQSGDSLFYISFPGDELATDGCLAAGRGFFHINSHGGAEPCPFSPYDVGNVAKTSLRQAMKSELFRVLQNDGLLQGQHTGGCVLFEHRDKVETLWRAAQTAESD
ncbi:MAG: radical SAM protein [Ruminococcaceae bacterium]|nr:radical SAM protein [Oscillospiraceae bacterium]